MIVFLSSIETIVFPVCSFLIEISFSFPFLSFYRFSLYSADKNFYIISSILISCFDRRYTCREVFLLPLKFFFKFISLNVKSGMCYTINIGMLGMFSLIAVLLGNLFLFLFFRFSLLVLFLFFFAYIILSTLLSYESSDWPFNMLIINEWISNYKMKRVNKICVLSPTIIDWEPLLYGTKPAIHTGASARARVHTHI